MNKLFGAVVLAVFLCSLLFSSCLNSSDDEGNEATNNCAITNVVLGSLHRTVTHRKTNGKDTTFVTNIAGSVYPMYIDQLKHEIYNADSLPVGTHVNAIVFSKISSDGTLAYRTEMGRDTLFNSADSLDFTCPRYFTCYSYTGNQKKTYKISINVHKVEPELFVWNQLPQMDYLADCVGQKVVEKESVLYLFVKNSAGMKLVRIPVDVPAYQTPVEMEGMVPTNVRDICVFNQKFYAVSEQKLVESEDGQTWTESSSQPFSFRSMVGSTDGFMFAIDSNSNVYRTLDGTNWTLDSLDSSADFLPVNNISCSSEAMNFNKNFINVFMTGENAASQSVVWKNTIDKTNQVEDAWSFYPSSDEIKYPLPSLSSSSMFEYDGRSIYVGCLNDSVSSFYISSDGGRNWIPNSSVYYHPFNLSASNLSCLVDSKHFIWLFCGGSGLVWRGRINRLAFANNQTSFIE